MRATLLWMFVVNLGIAFGAGLYEHRIVVPLWLSSSDNGATHWHADVVRRGGTGAAPGLRLAPQPAERFPRRCRT
jgi:hypothetical protein